jgi:ELWxxDGT repeat protein
MVKDIYPGSSSSNPINLTDVNGILFFRASDGTNGNELWKSDGTPDGTVMVKNINPTSDSNPSFLTNVNGTLFFVANDGTNGLELWKSDGTEAGTFMVKNIWPGSSGSGPYYLTNVNGILFFQASDGTNGYELWKSDGTSAGTVMVKNINPTGDSDPECLTNVNGILFFQANDATDGDELWKSDGTAAGTVMVKDIYPGSGSSSPSNLTNVNNILFFQAANDTNGVELWMDVTNDECQDAPQVQLGQTCNGSNVGATGYTYESSCGFNDWADVWYCFQPKVGGHYTVSAGSNDFDTTLNVFNACDEYQPLACNDDRDLQTTDSQVDLDMVKGKHYYIRVAGFDGQMGSFNLTVTAGACTGYAMGDLNGDCKVDMQDFAIMASEWLTCNKNPPELCGQ